MSSFPVLRTRNGRLYYTGHAVSQTGTWMNTAALAWLVLDLTDSGAAVGISASLQALPVLFVGPMAGVVVDRVSAYRVLLVVQAMTAAAGVLLGVLTVTGVVATWQVYALSLAFGLGRCFEIPSRQALLGEIVGRDLLRNAITLQATVNNAARIAGPSLGGLVIAGIGTGLCFILNGVSCLAMLGLLLALDRARLAVRTRAERRAVRFSEGLRHITHDPVAAPVVAISLLSGIFLQQYPTILPLLARRTFDGGPQAFGVLMSGLGVGAILGGVIVARRGSTGVRPVARACLAVSVAFAVVALMPTLGLAAAVMVLVGWANISLLTTANSTIQLSAGPEMQGRLVSLFAASNIGAGVLGAPLAGLLCDAVGAQGALLIGSTAGIATGVVGQVVARRTRRTAAAAAS